MKGFGVESCIVRILLDDEENIRELASCAPILETRPNSSALRLRKPDGLAAIHLAVGIILMDMLEGREANRRRYDGFMSKTRRDEGITGILSYISLATGLGAD